MDLPYCASLLPFLELLIYENLNKESVYYVWCIFVIDIA